jgi:hypothetical protein
MTKEDIVHHSQGRETPSTTLALIAIILTAGSGRIHTKGLR